MKNHILIALFSVLISLCTGQQACLERCRTVRRLARRDCSRANAQGSTCFLQRCTRLGQPDGWICSASQPTPTPSTSNILNGGCRNMCRRFRGVAGRDCRNSRLEGNRCTVSRCSRDDNTPGWICMGAPSVAPTPSASPSREPTACPAVCRNRFKAAKKDCVKMKALGATCFTSRCVRSGGSRGWTCSGDPRASASASTSTTPSTSPSSSSSVSPSSSPSSTLSSIPTSPVSISPSSSSALSPSVSPTTSVTVSVSASVSVSISSSVSVSTSYIPPASAASTSMATTTPSVSSTVSASSAPTISVTATVSPSISATSITAIVTATVSPSISATTATSVTAIVTANVSPSISATPATFVTATVSATVSATASASISATPTIPPPAVTLQSLSSTSFNAPGPLVFVPERTTFSTDANDVTLIVNNVQLLPSELTLTPTSLTVSPILSNGINNITLSIFSVGKVSLLELSEFVSVGTSPLSVNLITASNSVFTVQTSVEVVLSDDLNIKAEASTSNGTVTFFNIPPRTILTTAKSVNNDVGTVAVLGSGGAVNIVMAGFNAPSTIDNNNFTSGLSGWVVPEAGAVSLEIHQENVGPQPGASSQSESEGSPSTQDFGGPRVRLSASSRSVSSRATSIKQHAMRMMKQMNLSSSLFSFRQLENQDLVVVTANEGEQSVVRTFYSKFQSTGVTVRYRFVTSEVPGGYFGSQYNDYFSISIRSQYAGGAISESASMNGLGLGAFDYASGSTAWRETVLPLSEEGDIIEVRATVANVGDAAYSSRVILDFVEELDCTDGEYKEQYEAIGTIQFAGYLLTGQLAVNAAQNSGLPGAHNGQQDAFRHCTWNCRMTKVIGIDDAKSVGDIHEVCGQNPSAEFAMDLKNNEVGRGYGIISGGDCDDLCMAGVSNGELQISLM